MDKKRFTAIVLAAGSGQRMRSDVPKQFMEIDGHPLVYYSLKAFEESAIDSIVLVTGADAIEYCKNDIVEKYGFRKVEAVVAGGTERFLSVYEGLKACENTDYVLIHDGARPMLSQECLGQSIEIVQEEQACVLAVPVKDTIKIANAAGYVVDTPDRNKLWSMQTPQSFSYPLLKEAYEKLFALPRDEWPSITDDAMMVEYFLDKKVKLIEGDYHNLKVTTPEDLEITKMFLRNL